ncbi:hypothetical protein QE450_001290 [Paenibacillus sp. SORGH_AS306]|uniref:hypothetical protein n=2 Tax=Paenibacillus TaxID=44249 RepID=UPI002365DB49|nr:MULTISPECIES: hypothetical protein [unclassified Paenibacillus]MDQ1233792.1 hypothetical protein [Paenibacillus sp. SORGH_AS_0306]WDF49192.1 hypothetical protein PQ460_14350 [Paenibacillus sp. KACC 21273]
MSILYLFWAFVGQAILGIVITGLNRLGLAAIWLDYFPTVIVSILYFIGFMKLEKVNPQFAKGKPFAIAAAVLAVIQIFLPDQANVLPLPWWLTIVSLLVIIADLFIIYTVCKGIGQMAEAQNLPDFKKVSYQRWIIYVCNQILALAVLAISAFVSSTSTGSMVTLAGLLGVIYVVFGLLVYILMATFIWKAHQLLDIK